MTGSTHGGGFPPGGFGGPPPGGFGGPPAPPPGGFGGPPAPPPPGGFGYGPVGPSPMGYGPGGMMPPPPPSGGAGKVVAGIGIGCLVVLLFVGVGIKKLLDRPRSTSGTPAGAATVGGPAEGAGTGAGAVERVVEFKQLTIYRGKVGKMAYLAGVLENKGTVAVALPSGKVTLFDKAGTAVDSTSCYAPGVRGLAPGETVPCTGIFAKGEAFESYKAVGESMPIYGKLERADLKLADVQTLTPSNPYAPYKVVGVVTNQSAFQAKSVWIAVALYDEADKLCGAGQGFAPGNDVDAGGAAKFEVAVYNVASKPKRFEAKAFGFRP